MTEEAKVIVEEPTKKLDKEKVKKIAIIGGCAVAATGLVVLIAKTGNKQLAEAAVEVAEAAV